MELGTLGLQLCIHFLTNWQLRPAFSGKKNFENLSKIDRIRGKNVNWAPIFRQLPPALVVGLLKFDFSDMPEIESISMFSIF